MRLACLAVAVLAAPVCAHASEVVARVSGVIGTVGDIRVSVCTQEEYRTRICRLRGHAPARGGTVEVRVSGVPPGVYAVIAHHDRAGDGVVHTDWLGIPRDGVGVSRNVAGRFGPPGFDAVALTIPDGTVAVEITLRQEPAE